MVGVAGRSGRKPDPDAARRLRADDPQRFVKWINLPPEGNTAEPPEMPPPPAFVTADGEWSVRAIDLWHKLWHSPQSTKWQAELHPMLERYLLITERMWLFGSYTPGELSALQATEEAMGLTPKSMRHLNWRIYADEGTEEVELASVSAMKTGTKANGRRDIDYS